MKTGCALDSRKHATMRGRAGFTLVEVLVVLSILVILFALLFAPMIASLDMVTVGQTRVTMQNAVRGAMEDIRRELGNAMYVYPTPGVTLKGSDGLLGTADDVRIPNLSEIVFVGPARTNTGELIEPLSPRVDSTGQIVATRLRVALLDETQAYGEFNPFVLVREEGYYERYEDANAVWWEFTNLGGATNPIRNLLTPRSGYDIPVTYSICATCGEVVRGYIDSCPAGCTGDIYYMHEGVRFQPERVAGEVLEPLANYTIYQARHGSWAGLHNSGNVDLNDIAPKVAPGMVGTLGISELDPRLVFVNPTDMSVVQDSVDPTTASSMVVTWNSDRGAVQVGAPTATWVNVTDPTAAVLPGQYYEMQVQGERPDFAATTVDAYDSNGTLTGARQWDLIPIYPSLGPLTCTDCGGTYSPTQYNVGDPCPDPSCAGTLISTAQPGDPAMPIAYRLDVTRAGTLAPAKIVPGSVHVVVWAVDSNGQPYQETYTETTNTDQSQIGDRQFAVVYSSHNQVAEVRFNELRPPSPRLFDTNGDHVVDSSDLGGPTLEYFGVYIQYYFRRNYDPAAPENDYIVRADYSTQEIINLHLRLQRYWEPEPDPTNPDALIIPADATPDQVSLKDQVTLRNLSP